MPAAKTAADKTGPAVLVCVMRVTEVLAFREFRTCVVRADKPFRLPPASV